MSLRVALLALSTLLLPGLSLAQSSRLPGPRTAEFSAVQIEKRLVKDRFVVLKEPTQGSRTGDQAAAGAEDGKDGKGDEITDLAELLGGVGPWPFFAGLFDESGCRSPRISRAALVAAAICGGKGSRSGRTEYVVIREGDGARLYRVPVYADGGEIALSDDGRRLAVVVTEDQRSVLHVLDLVSNEFVQISGAFESPRGPALAEKAAVVAFEATVDGTGTVIRADLDGDGALLAWSDGGDAALLGISEDGNRLLVRNRRVDFSEVFVVDPLHARIFDISERSGDVNGAALHKSGSYVVFSAQVGGACGLYWADLVTRRRKNLLGTVEHCFGEVQIDDDRRFIYYEQTLRRGASRHLLRDRMSRRDEPHTELPAGCDEVALEPTGRYLAAFCRESGAGSGLFVRAIDQQRRKR